MNKIRVRAENGPKIEVALKAAGFEARYLGPGTAETTLFGGCHDPECCQQHAAYGAPMAWGTVVSTASGRQAHRVIAAALGFRVVAFKATQLATEPPCDVCGNTGSATGCGGDSGYEGPCHFPVQKGISS